MERREFIRRLGLGLLAGWAGGRLACPWPAWAAGPAWRLALLADAHLKNGDDRRPEALALARAVAEIRSLSPPPDLVLFAGDLAHRGRPDALDLGREILSDLPAALWAVPGEGDHGPRGSAWTRRFGESRFSRTWRGFQILGLHTSLKARPGRPVFEIGAVQRQWLAAELARLDPATPLIVVSHAPLTRIFHPWQQWTADALEVAHLLARFSLVLCLHGHVHGAGGREQRSEVMSFTGNQQPATENHLSLPATAWPRPLAVQGTPARLRPGLAPHGCGWALATLAPGTANFQPYLWRV
jgi:Icc protein